MFNRGIVREDTRRGAGNSHVNSIRFLRCFNVFILPGTQEKQC